VRRMCHRLRMNGLTRTNSIRQIFTDLKIQNIDNQ
jgi:hypothetical protein